VKKKDTLKIYVLEKLKHISIYFPTHPIDSTEFTDAMLRAEFAEQALNTEVAEPKLAIDATDKTERTEPAAKNDRNDKIVRNERRLIITKELPTLSTTGSLSSS